MILDIIVGSTDPEVLVWASWADSLGMFHNRHSNVADAFLECLTVGAGPPSLVAAHSAREELSYVMGFQASCFAWCTPSFSG